MMIERELIFCSIIFGGGTLDLGRFHVGYRICAFTSVEIARFEFHQGKEEGSSRSSFFIIFFCFLYSLFFFNKSFKHASGNKFVIALALVILLHTLFFFIFPIVEVISVFEVLLTLFF